MNIDLHIHSYFSDGSCSPQEIILESKKNKISALSITDHNTIQYSKDISEIAKQSDVHFVEGIEISTLHRLPSDSISLHVLGYGEILNRKVLRQQLQKTINGYNTRAQKIINKLNREFPELQLDFEILKENNHEAYVSRNTLAGLLVDHLKNISIKDALKRCVFVEEDDSWMMKPEDSFQLIARAGGIPVLAHSGTQLRKMGLAVYESMIQQFVQAGLRGLEVYYPKHTTEEIDTIRNIANKYKLYITGGSDWHGSIYTPDIQIGIDGYEKDFAPFLKDILGNSEQKNPGKAQDNIFGR